MNLLSVVIITRNEEHNITDCIQSAKLVSDDIIVVDAGSDDQTVKLATDAGATVFSIAWKGYGFSRNFGAAKAKNDWIFSLDADERVSSELASAIQQISFSKENSIYRFLRRNHMGNNKFRFGTLGFETVKRIYNRKFAKWDLTLVHERLESEQPSKKKIAGYIDHFGLKNENDYKARAVLYAHMSAEKYFLQGKKVSPFKKYSSPLFNSIKSFLFQLGFLDGKSGWVSAKTIAYYSWLKYFYLQQLSKESAIEALRFSSKAQAKRA